MSEAEIIARLAIESRLANIECRLPPPLCDKVGHEKERVDDPNTGLSWYACKHCGKDEDEIVESRRRA